MLLKALLPLTLLAVAIAPAPTLPATPSHLTAQYVEARTASVFAGACHYNGELVTIGQDAVLAWHVTGGVWNGVDLSGVNAMAAVDSSDNLGKDAPRKSELVIDSHASDAQATAFADMVRSKLHGQLGDVIAVRRGPVTFSHDDANYSVVAANFGEMSVQPMPNGECCKQPNLVWYSPLIPLEGRKVGYTQDAGYSAGNVGDPWERSDENSAFYGTYSF
ncbi:MAG TPA: DUF1326 domain-containing protein [Phycisphaerae bacterium]|nr:DUF1326 domain-containing protein [Phycisphaerae bacterium]